MSARRPLMTAASAGTLLCALWFVPSANAMVDAGRPATQRPSVEHAQSQRQSQPQSQPQSPSRSDSRSAGAAATGAGARSQDLALADTGSVDTTPYLIGGTGFLSCGAALVAITALRSRTTAAGTGTNAL